MSPEDFQAAAPELRKRMVIELNDPGVTNGELDEEVFENGLNAGYMFARHLATQSDKTYDLPSPYVTLRYAVAMVKQQLNMARLKYCTHGREAAAAKRMVEEAEEQFVSLGAGPYG